MGDAESRLRDPKSKKKWNFKQLRMMLYCYKNNLSSLSI